MIIILLLIIVIIFYYSFYNKTEGFYERPEFKTKRENIISCLNDDCIKNKVNSCIEMCHSGILDSETQSPGYQVNCEFNCLEFGDQIRDSLNYQLAIFNRLPVSGDYIPAYY